MPLVGTSLLTRLYEPERSTVPPAVSAAAGTARITGLSLRMTSTTALASAPALLVASFALQLPAVGRQPVERSLTLLLSTGRNCTVNFGNTADRLATAVWAALFGAAGQWQLRVLSAARLQPG